MSDKVSDTAPDKETANESAAEQPNPQASAAPTPIPPENPPEPPAEPVAEQPAPAALPEVIDDDDDAVLEADEVILPHVEHLYRREDFTCVRCGSRNLARGLIVDYGEKFEQVRFAPRRITLGWLNSLFNLRPWRGLLKLEALACRDCGAVQLEVNPDELRRAERVRDEE